MIAMWLRRFVVGTALSGALTVASPVWASAFNVSPTRIVLTPAETSVIVTLRNDSERTIRFQLTANTWSQDDEGRWMLGKTTDIVIYPPLVSVAAHESKRIRIGTQAQSRALEAAYRLFVEELPDESSAPNGGRAIQVRARIGIPIFQHTGKAKAQSVIENFGVLDGEIGFSVHNVGSAHTIIQGLKLRGIGLDGRNLFENTAEAGYLLAQHRQNFALTFDPAQCAKTKQLVITAITEDGTITGTADVAQSACTARGKPSVKK